MRPDFPVMLFTAGFGTRMAPLTDRLPKALIPVAGRPLVDHALDLVDGAGLTRLVANTHFLADMVSKHLSPRGVICVHEPEILETGGGLRNAVPWLGAGPVITLNTDAVWTGDNPIPRLLNAWQPGKMDALLLVVPTDRAVGHRGAGDFAISPDGRLRRGGDNVYSGLQIIRTTRLRGIVETKFSLNVVWDMMAAEGTLYGLEHLGGWCDVGRLESIASAEAMLGQANV